eukprot:scaffold11508_cov84-Isochrysis_galbana.AAC.2
MPGVKGSRRGRPVPPDSHVRGCGIREPMRARCHRTRTHAYTGSCPGGRGEHDTGTPTHVARTGAKRRRANVYARTHARTLLRSHTIPDI